MDFDWTLSNEAVMKIDGLLSLATLENRTQLYEHEIYEILRVLGIRTPTYRFVRRPEEITAELLLAFRSRNLILKIVSHEIAHKAKAGGVRKIVRDADFARYMAERMMAEIPRHPSFAQPPVVAGVLITEFINHTQDLGNEILIACRENLAFGPVLSFSKGGSDAEHFAKYYSRPNLAIAPIPYKACRRLIEDTMIFRKYVEEGHEGYADQIAETLFKFSQLAAHYSSFSSLQARLILQELEINPFVFDINGKLIALDGLGSVIPADRSFGACDEPNVTNLDCFFYPNGIAVVGVSASDSSKTGNIIASLLHSLNRADLYLVNPKGGEATIGGRAYPLHRSLTEIPEPIDLVVVTVPAPLTPDVIREVKAKGARAVVLIPGGFREVHGETTLEEQIQKIVRDTEIRIIGPNCLGVFHAPREGKPGVNTIFIPESKLRMIPRKRADVALVSQSGAASITLLDKLQHAIYPHAIVSYGNQMDVDPADLLAYFDKVPEIAVVAAYIEGFKACAGRKFFDTASKIATPVIVYKAGRTDAGARAAASHTAAMAGDYAVAKAALQQAGVIVTETLLDLKDLVKTFALLSGRRPRGRRVAGVVNAGFESTYAADSLDKLETANFSERTLARLKKILPPIVGINPFLDLTPMADDALFETCVEIVLEDDNVDSVFISIVPHTPMLHTTIDEIEKDTEHIARRIIRQHDQHDKPIVLSVNAGTMYNAMVDILEQGGIPTYTTAERAMHCLNRFADHCLGR